MPVSCPASSAEPRTGVSERREKNPVWMSRARSVPAFIVEKRAPWMNGHGEREGEERVGREPRQLRRRLEAARVEEQERDGEDERRDRARGLARGAHDRALRESTDLRRQGAHRAGCPVLPGGGALERAPGLREEDVVERRGPQLDVVDDDAVRVHGADHVGHADAVAQAHGEVAVVPELLAEARRAAPRSAAGPPPGTGSRGCWAGRSPPSAPPACPRRRSCRGR